MMLVSTLHGASVNYSCEIFFMDEDLSVTHQEAEKIIGDTLSDVIKTVGLCNMCDFY